ncbi:MAG: hypothetical protein JWM53_4805 [bacterium]|nr:hypothetical protein [bacterium]
MNDSRDALAELVSSAGKEIARLGRIEAVDLRDELRFRLWPFLAELGEAIQVALDEEHDPATVPVDLVARTVSLILAMANELGQHVPPAAMEELAARAASVAEDLMELCDPDELASYIAADGAHVTPFDRPVEGRLEEGIIVDTTAETIESQSEPAVPDSSSEQTES